MTPSQPPSPPPPPATHSTPPSAPRWLRLKPVVFCTGAAVLILEVTAIRILSPYFGNTLYTFSSVLAVILCALSVGYLLGGRLADRHASPGWLFGIITGSGMCLLLLILLMLTLLPVIGYTLSLRIGPLVASVILFVLPSFLLGTVTPLAASISQKMYPSDGTGRITGGIAGWSTVGSITGSLAAGFILIPSIGVRAILLGTAGFLMLLGILGLVLTRSRGPLAGLLPFVIGMAASSPMLLAPQHPNALFAKDGMYEQILVQDFVYKDHPTRILRQDRSLSSGIFLDSSELAFDYTKYYKLYKFLTPQLNRALVLGAGAYTIPRVLRQNEPEAHIDVVDIEPGLEALSEEFFGFVPDPHIQTHVTDGRRFLQEADTPYDFIFSDVYYSLSIPTHMATREFFTLASKQLSPEGVFVANIIGRMDADTPSLLPSLMRTFEESFPATAYFAVDSPESPALQNFIFVGHTGGEPIDACSAAFQDHTDPFLRTLCPHQMDPSTMNLAAHPLITDDYAPLEYLTSRALAVVTPLTAK